MHVKNKNELGILKWEIKLWFEMEIYNQLKKLCDKPGCRTIKRKSG